MKYIAVGCTVFLGLLFLATAMPGSADPPKPGPSDYPVIDPGQEPRMWCRQANPACHREPWWAEWDETPLPGRCRYRFLPDTFVSDCALAEAVVLVSQWGNGARLLQRAATWGVTVVIAPQQQVGQPSRLAHYDRSDRMVRISEGISRISTWMLAAVIVHELTHAQQHQQGLRGSCAAREQPAYQTEGEFARWVASRMGGWPSRSAVAQHLSQPDLRVFDHLTRLQTADSVRNHVSNVCANPDQLW